VNAVERESAFDALKRAIVIAGSQSAVAKAAGCTPGNIWQLVKKRRPLPARWVPKVSAATGVPKHELCPDVFTPEHPQPPAIDRIVAGGEAAASCDRPPILQVGEAAR
jgi:DNA-binding transcriptional regulator YdaS (Cro superfamily)